MYAMDGFYLQDNSMVEFFYKKQTKMEILHRHQFSTMNLCLRNENELCSGEYFLVKIITSQQHTHATSYKHHINTQCFDLGLQLHFSCFAC